jgi:beta-lactamase class D
MFQLRATVLILIGIGSLASVRSQESFEARSACFMLQSHDGSTNVRRGELCERRFSPCSTFKIPNALLAFELGTVSGPDEIFRWDGTSYSRAEWNQDLDLRTAMSVSCVWCFKDLARRAGRAAMKAHLEKWRYGNADISGGIDRFWLGSSLQISPIEQVRFITRLWRGELSARTESVDQTKSLLLYSKGNGYALSGKTGTCLNDNQFGHCWYLGVVENGDRKASFVMLIQGQDVLGTRARELAIRELETLGWLARERE